MRVEKANEVSVTIIIKVVFNLTDFSKKVEGSLGHTVRAVVPDRAMQF
jgi:hypothetical protein